jgi:hypothetical protein
MLYLIDHLILQTPQMQSRNLHGVVPVYSQESARGGQARIAVELLARDSRSGGPLAR